MRGLNKKGLSAMVVSTLLIATAIAAATLLYVQIKPLLNLSPVACTELQLLQPYVIENACYNADTEEIELTLSRTNDALSASKLEFDLFREGASSNWRCDSSCGDCTPLQEGEKRTYYLSTEESWNSINVKVNSCTITASEITSC